MWKTKWEVEGDMMPAYNWEAQFICPLQHSAEGGRRTLSLKAVLLVRANWEEGMGDVTNVKKSQTKELAPNRWSWERHVLTVCITSCSPPALVLFPLINGFNWTFFDVTVLVLSLVPDIFLACKCYHELLLVAMVVQKMDPLGRKQGSWAAVPPCWGIAKQGFSFIHPVFLSLHFCSSTAYYEKQKMNSIRYSCNLKQEEKIYIKKRTLLHFTYRSVLILFSAEIVNFKFTGASPLEGMRLSKYPRNSKGAVLYRTMLILGIWIYTYTF